MDRTKLASRLHDIVRGTRGPGPVPPAGSDEISPGEAVAGTGDRAEWSPSPVEVLGATELRGPRGRCYLVERRFAADQWHGGALIGEYAEYYTAHQRGLPLVAPDLLPVADRLPEGLLFFDLETTGLSGGAGTYAFLVGCGSYEGGAFRTAQYFMADFDQEDAVLEAVAERVAAASAVVTYNGRTFDLPLIETRYQVNRLDSPFGGLPHLDTLHPARRLWRRSDRSGRTVPAARASHVHRASARSVDEDRGCSLGALEQRVLGLGRVGDVPGMEIPGRYFQYLRSGDAGPLAEVFSHNRLDLVSLAALTATALRLVSAGPDAAPGERECLSLGRVYERAGDLPHAEASYRRAAGLDGTVWPGPGIEAADTRAEALYRLAVSMRRQRRYEEATNMWRQLATLEADRTAPAHEAFEALEALAIHHEHRVRDYEAARSFALRALGHTENPDDHKALRHRLARLERKLGVQLGWDDKGS